MRTEYQAFLGRFSASPHLILITTLCVSKHDSSSFLLTRKLGAQDSKSCCPSGDLNSESLKSQNLEDSAGGAERVCGEAQGLDGPRQGC